MCTAIQRQKIQTVHQVSRYCFFPLRCGSWFDTQTSNRIQAIFGNFLVLFWRRWGLLPFPWSRLPVSLTSCMEAWLLWSIHAAVQRQTAITSHFSSEQLPLFAFALAACHCLSLQRRRTLTAYFSSKKLLCFSCTGSKPLSPLQRKTAVTA